MKRYSSRSLCVRHIAKANQVCISKLHIVAYSAKLSHSVSWFCQRLFADAKQLHHRRTVPTLTIKCEFEKQSFSSLKFYLLRFSYFSATLQVEKCSYFILFCFVLVLSHVLQQMDVKMHLDVHPQHLQQEQMLESDDVMKNSSRPRRKSSFRRMYEACDRMVQLYFAEGDAIKVIFMKLVFVHRWHIICFPSKWFPVKTLESSNIWFQCRNLFFFLV